MKGGQRWRGARGEHDGFAEGAALLGEAPAPADGTAPADGAARREGAVLADGAALAGGATPADGTAISEGPAVGQLTGAIAGACWPKPETAAATARPAARAAPPSQSARRGGWLDTGSGAASIARTADRSGNGREGTTANRSSSPRNRRYTASAASRAASRSSCAGAGIQVSRAANP